MSGLGNEYNAEISMFEENCRTLRDIDPNNEHLQLIVFEDHEQVLVKSGFWNKYGPKNKKISHYGLHAFANANKKLKEAIKDARKKGLVSKID